MRAKESYLKKSLNCVYPFFLLPLLSNRTDVGDCICAIANIFPKVRVSSGERIDLIDILESNLFAQV